MNANTTGMVRKAAPQERVADVLRQMAVGEKVAFDADRTLTVRSAASNYGMALGALFRTRANRAEMTIEVERIE